jgi:type IV secretion system protein VirB9
VFAPRADLPAIFVENPDGTESLVNVTVEADAVRVHRVAERLIVRRGRQGGCIVNQAFSGGGDRLSSGTVAPDVVRRTREGEP